MKRDRRLRRDVIEIFLRRDDARWEEWERRVEERLKVRVLPFLVEPRAERHVQPLAKCHRGLPEQSKSDIVQRGLRKVLIEAKVDERRDQSRRIAVDRVLLVVLGEQEYPGLPVHRQVVRQADGRGRRGGKARLVRELQVVLAVVAADERQRRVVEIGQVAGVPTHHPRRRREIHPAAPPARRECRGQHVAVRLAFEVAGDRERISAQGREIAERVVAVAGALAGHDDARFPGVRRRPDDLRPARERLARVEVVARHAVRREPVARRVVERRAEAEFPVLERSGHAALDTATGFARERHVHRTAPCGKRRAPRRDVHDPAKRVPPDIGRSAVRARTRSARPRGASRSMSSC